MSAFHYRWISCLFTSSEEFVFNYSLESEYSRALACVVQMEKMKAHDTLFSPVLHNQNRGHVRLSKTKRHQLKPVLCLLLHVGVWRKGTHISFDYGAEQGPFSRGRPVDFGWLYTYKKSQMVDASRYIYTMLVVWFLERPYNPEFNGPWKNQISTALWYWIILYLHVVGGMWERESVKQKRWMGVFSSSSDQKFSSKTQRFLRKNESILGKFELINQIIQNEPSNLRIFDSRIPNPLIKFS
jgi:hypothetical protein